jgi:hypothetical protein
VDGNLLPPNIINKLNIFMVNVLRFGGNADLSGLLDRAEVIETTEKIPPEPAKEEQMSLK